jgi:hypothetical protein
MKQMMEIIILRVSSIMKENKCGDAIQVACLRIRDVAGREIDMDEVSLRIKDVARLGKKKFPVLFFLFIKARSIQILMSRSPEPQHLKS